MLILLLLTILSGVGMEVYLKANLEKTMLKREVQSRQALYAAEGGIEWAKAHLRLNSELRQGNIVLATGRASIYIKVNGSGYDVISEGHSGLSVRVIEEQITSESEKWTLTSYQELHGDYETGQ